MSTCTCLEKMGGVKHAIIWLIFLIILALLLSLVFGSYAEMEPTAGKMFGIITVLYIVIVGFLLWRITGKWRNASGK